MQSSTHTFTTESGTEATLVLKNTMFNYVLFLELSKAFAGDDLVDSAQRSDFCWVNCHVDKVDGLEWSPVGRGVSQTEFEECYHTFLKLVDDEGFYDCVRAVNKLKSRTDPVEKAKAALTPEEQADPNS